MAAEERLKRLCTEIQLFDLCEKTKCGSRDGRFCTDESLLNSFEAISQEDDFPAEQYLADELEEDDEEAVEEDGFYPGLENDFDDDEDEDEEVF